MAARKKVVYIEDGAVVNCKHCAYYKPEENERNKEEDWGYCFRYPPVVVTSSENDTKSTFPHVKEEWKCGEFRQRMDS